ncbi:MAG: hypothetical protein ABH828_05050 [archaeon]
MLKRIEAKKEKRKKFWIGAILVFLMGFSMLGVFTNSSGNQKWEYNNFKFTQEQNFFVTKIDRTKMGFNFLPQTLESINITGDLKNKIISPSMFITFDPDSDLQNLLYIDTIRNDLQATLNSAVVNAKTKESDTYVLPIITCENATQFVPVIYLNVSNTTSVEETNGCVVLNGQTTEFFKLRDLIVYTYYGVMND